MKNTKKNQKNKRQTKKKIRDIARSVAIDTASEYIGKTSAKLAYKGALAVKRSIKPQKGLVLSKMASMYGRAFATPFAESVKMVGIPKNPAVPSYKATGFVRGMGAIGAAQFGFIAIAPCLASDKPFVYYSTSNYGLSNSSAPPSDVSIATSKTGGATFPAWTEMSNLPFTYSQLTTTTNVTNSSTDVGGRIVSVAVKIEYTSTALNRSGQFYVYCDPQCNNVLGDNHPQAANGSGYYTATLAQKDACEIINIQNRTSASMVVLGCDENMDDYPRQSNTALRKVYPYSSGEFYTVNAGTDSTNGAAMAMIGITGVAGSTFYFEVICHVEYIGIGIPQGLLTESRSDVVGYDAIKNVLLRSQRAVASNPQLTFQKAYAREMKREGLRYGNGFHTN